MGLREQKKEQTRARLTETAWRLAAERGFERVTVAEIARAAEVSEATVFNYFRTKEDVFYAPLEAFGDRLIEAVRTRPAETSPLDAVRDFLMQSHGLLGRLEPNEEEARERLHSMVRVISESPALLDREQRAFARYTEDLATLLAEEAGEGDPVASAVVAHALIGVHRSLVGYVRQRVLAGASLPRVADEVRDHCRRSFSLLESGLGR
ncbi:TetR/AcrR family transcriptional regulator [Phytoactinopolyspora halotolerans]|uniref:TetR/AcrR family transcriptional regulator n=1 Tax=Phytoactinopolyspora halotolerans TaxID=1981512 RepID=A0A6L9S7J6_9ACTN|nr:TetR/AcrR family transcriptional regulator [Phytoactinopolyspora halotolerans]NEE01059.1 TetR/AcrR family transcriptional regulator [Phytoactinopolyspora halotolerans]